MQNITETRDEHRQPTSDPVKDLAAATQRLVAGVCAAEPDRVGIATAGAVLAATDRLTAAVVEVLARVSHRGVIADEGLSAGAWLRTFAARTVADERMLANTVERLRDMPTLAAVVHRRGDLVAGGARHCRGGAQPDPRAAPLAGRDAGR